MKILLIGATGTIGEAIGDRLKELGHEVVGVSRKTTPSLDISQPEQVKAFLASMDPVHHIVCTGGGAHFGGTLDEITDEQIYVGINSKMMGQVNVVRYGHSKVKKGGSILLTGGLLA